MTYQASCQAMDKSGSSALMKHSACNGHVPGAIGVGIAMGMMSMAQALPAFYKALIIKGSEIR
jgi:hypothetical protein